jgi:tRNA A-37 threonylcarbamoyl transferase component Bud32
MCATDWVPGAVIAARYRLDRRVGEGGMGVIWAADDLVAGRRTALKQLKDTIDDPAARRRFLHEARAASAVRHPNVVEIFDVLELEDGPPALAMELLDGESLRDVLVRDRTLSVPTLAEILVPVISAVGAAHALGVVHRDLKPENIFLARDAAGAQVVKVLDFGIAKLTALDGDAMRSAGLTTTAVLGTPAYMAPEQVFGERDIDHRADIWALGVVVYECLAGVRPTDGDNVGQVLKHVLARPFVPLARQVDDVPEGVSRLVERMLMRERSHRPADLHEVVAVLEPFASAPGAPFSAPAAHFARAGEAAVAETVPVGPGETAVAETVPVGRRPGKARSLPPPRDRVAPSPQPTRWRPHRRVLLGFAAALALMGLGLVWTRRSSTELPPLADPTSKLACPILRVSGVDKPAGWLGAAAAAIACERARLLLGGRGERTLVPAELLGLPREPSDKFPEAPYDDPGARDTTVDAARQRAQAYLDGEVTWSSPGFEVTLALVRADGTEIARSDGRGPALYEAVRSAQARLTGAALIPRASKLDPETATWSRTDDVDAALGMLDLTIAFVQNAGDLGNECHAFEQRNLRVGELRAEALKECAYSVGEVPPDVAIGASGSATADLAAASRVTRIRLEYCLHETGSLEDLQFLRSRLPDEPTSGGRSLIAATASCLLQSQRGGEADARLLAIQAVRSEPSNPGGGCCNPWEQLMTLERDTGETGAIRAMQAWVPWNSYAWLEPGFRVNGKDPATLPWLRRAYLLSPLDSLIARTLARGLIASEDSEAARGIAANLRDRKRPLYDLESDLILAEIATRAGRFGEALRMAKRASAISRADTGWLLVQRFDAGRYALEMAVLAGKAPEVADDLIHQFLDPDPTPLDPKSPSVPEGVPAICVRASRASACLAHFRSLQAKLPGALTPENDALLTGAEHYVDRRYADAAKAWRPLTEGTMKLALTLPEAMVAAFEAVGDDNLASRVDREVMQRAPDFHGATLGHVREAHRAQRRGDLKEARRLAQQVIDAWSVADEELPAVQDMQRLLRALPPR